MVGDQTFTWPDYLVFGLALLASVAIGIYYACSGGKQKTTKEYLLADRHMNWFPIAASMLARYVQVLPTLRPYYIQRNVSLLYGDVKQEPTSRLKKCQQVAFFVPSTTPHVPFSARGTAWLAPLHAHSPNSGMIAW